MRQYLVVANQTLESEPLADQVRTLLAAGPCAFFVLVPATHPRHQMVWTEGTDRAIAQRRLDKALERFRSMGAAVDGEVGDERPVDAVGDVLRRTRFDEMIVVTYPPGVSRWLRQDLPHRLQRAFGVPVTHLVTPAPALHNAS